MDYHPFKVMPTTEELDLEPVVSTAAAARTEWCPLMLTSQGNASSWIKTTLMLEEYLDGPEVDVDLIFSEGAPVYGAITDNWPTIEPYFNETGSNCPSILPRNQQRELMDLGIQSVQALGFDQVNLPTPPSWILTPSTPSTVTGSKVHHGIGVRRTSG